MRTKTRYHPSGPGFFWEKLMVKRSQSPSRWSSQRPNWWSWQLVVTPAIISPNCCTLLHSTYCTYVYIYIHTHMIVWYQHISQQFKPLQWLCCISRAYVNMLFCIVLYVYVYIYIMYVLYVNHSQYSCYQSVVCRIPLMTYIKQVSIKYHYNVVNSIINHPSDHIKKMVQITLFPNGTVVVYGIGFPTLIYNHIIYTVHIYIHIYIYTIYIHIPYNIPYIYIHVSFVTCCCRMHLLRGKAHSPCAFWLVAQGQFQRDRGKISSAAIGLVGR